MKDWVFTFCFLMMSVGNIFSQTNQSPPTPAPPAPASPQTGSGTNNGQSRGSAQGSRSNEAQINDAFLALRMLDVMQTDNNSSNVMNDLIRPLYNKPHKKDLKDLIPSQSMLTQYEKFLKQPGTGIFKLSADSSCLVNTKVIVVKENCPLNSVMGGGTAYSFRVKSHWMLHLSDLILENNIIKTDSLLQQGVMVNLGNVELEGVNAQTNGLKYLFEFKPATDKESLTRTNELLNQGIKADGFIYRYGFFAEDKMTFALRSIAYRGKVARSINGVNYNELDFDKRKDVIIVFRIIEKDANGDITILWKELVNKESPKLKIGKDEN